MLAGVGYWYDMVDEEGEDEMELTKGGETTVGVSSSTVFETKRREGVGVREPAVPPSAVGRQSTRLRPTV